MCRGTRRLRRGGISPHDLPGVPASHRQRSRRTRPVAGRACFNSILTTACVMDELQVGVASMGIIEHAFAGVSATIGRAVVERGWMTRERLVHYALHAEIDTRHAEEFFAVVEPEWGEEDRRYLIDQGLQRRPRLSSPTLVVAHACRRPRLSSPTLVVAHAGFPMASFGSVRDATRAWDTTRASPTIDARASLVGLRRSLAGILEHA